jgi:hypothetical protein
MNATPNYVCYFAMPQAALMGTDLTTESAWRITGTNAPPTFTPIFATAVLFSNLTSFHDFSSVFPASL